MNSVGIVLDRILERRMRAGYRAPPRPREHMPPDLAETCARYPTAALLSFLAVLGGTFAVVVLLIALLVTANAKPNPAGIPKTVPSRTGSGQRLP
jgi:hypothetical protein